jgi:molybdenum cofactor synthesis domain-containing protein
MKAGILTVSDRSSNGVRPDLGGPAIRQWLHGNGVETVRCNIVPDETVAIAAVLREWADEGVVDLILTTGGTGVSPRDVTPEATMQVLDRVIPGFGELMRAESLSKTPMAILSCAVAGIRKQALIINLPGSPKGALENLAAVWAAVPHAVEKIQGDQRDCSILVSAAGSE